MTMSATLPRTRIDSSALYCALEVRRIRDGLSWRDVARQASVSPALLTRLKGGASPDSEKLCALCDWLGESLDAFRVPVLLPTLVDVDLAAGYAEIEALRSSAAN
jgi:transcriptional regulator with XRE-family HTH domain